MALRRFAGLAVLAVLLLACSATDVNEAEQSAEVETVEASDDSVDIESGSVPALPPPEPNREHERSATDPVDRDEQQPLSGLEDEASGDDPSKPAEPTDAQAVTSPTLELAHSAVTAPGDAVTLSVSGLRPGSAVQVTLFSAPIALGSFVVGSSGSLEQEVRIPENIAPGRHTLVVNGESRQGQPVELRQQIRLVPTRVPVLESFSVTSSGPYSAGDEIRVSFTWRAESASGLEFVQFRFEDSIGRPYIASGRDFTGGSGTVSVTLDDQAAGGSAGLNLIELRDTRGNSIVYYYQPYGSVYKNPGGAEGPTSHSFDSPVLDFATSG